MAILLTQLAHGPEQLALLSEASSADGIVLRAGHAQLTTASTLAQDVPGAHPEKQAKLTRELQQHLRWFATSSPAAVPDTKLCARCAWQHTQRSGRTSCSSAAC